MPLEQDPLGAVPATASRSDVDRPTDVTAEIPASAVPASRSDSPSGAPWQGSAAGAALAAGPVVVAVVLRLLVGVNPNDDAYITFRYARNIAGGLGFVYNPGQHVIGTTTPLFTLVTALLYRLGLHDLMSASLVLNSLADGVTTLLVFWVARSVGVSRGWSGLAALLFAVCPLSIAWAVSGMETSVFTMLIVAACCLMAAGRSGPAGLVAGLAALTRPEGLIVAACILAAPVLSHRRFSLRATLGFLTPVMPWLIFAGWWTGTPVPHSIVAKSVAYQGTVSVRDALQTLVATFALPGMRPWQSNYAYYTSVSKLVVLPIALVVIALLVLGISRLRPLMRWLPNHLSYLPLVLFAPILTVAYALAGLRGDLIFPWYMPPLTPFFALGVVVALYSLARRLSPVLRAGVAAAPLLWMLLGMSLGRDPAGSLIAPLNMEAFREYAYIRAAHILAPRVNAHTTVALPEIGSFGYASRARILDTVGLVSPGAVKYYPLPHSYKAGSIPPRLIRQARPDYLVAFNTFIAPQMQRAGWFRRDYRLAMSLPATHRFWATKALLIYKRVHT